MRELSAQTKATIGCFQMEAASQDVGLEEFHWRGDSLIPHARNICLAQFLKSDCDELFFLDSDVACGAGVFTRMLTHRVDIVAGVYRFKCDDEKYPVTWKPGVDKRIVDVRTGLLAAENVPFGFVRISRSMIEFLCETYPNDWFNTHLMPDTKIPALFNTLLENNQFWGEDYYFCKRLRATKHMIWVDPEIPLMHVGDKIYPGHLGRHLRACGEYFKPPVIAEVGPAVAV